MNQTNSGKPLYNKRVLVTGGNRGIGRGIKNFKEATNKGANDDNA